MSAQPEALRLADELDGMTVNEFYEALGDEAAAELRRLHQFAEDQIGRATAAEATLQMTKATHALKIAAVEAQRDALLEACQTLVNLPEDWIATLRLLRVAVEQARAAIKAVEGENHAKNL